MCENCDGVTGHEEIVPVTGTVFNWGLNGERSNLFSESVVVKR